MKVNAKRIICWVLELALVVTLLCPALMPSASALSYSGSSSYRSGKYYTQLTKVKLTGNQRTDIVNIAKSQIGYQEGSSSSKLSGTVRGSGNCTEYGRWYGMQDMWCAMFVSWCANVAGVKTSVVPSHAYTPSGLQWFINRGRAYSRSTVANGGYKPQPGDIIYFKSARNSNICNHVGIVTSYSNGVVYTVEGNTSSATISTNGGAVAAKSYSISNTYIRYICKPAYSGTSINTNTSSTTTTTSSTSTSSLTKNAVFNATYYANKYADLKAAFGTDATKLYNHYLQYGIKEGRQASPIFSVKHYISGNSDLKAAFGSNNKSGYDHFLKYGYKEARNTAPYANVGTNFYAEIRNVNAGLNLSINSDTGEVLTYHDTSSDAQTWKFVRQSDGSYKIINKKTGKCLDVSGGVHTSGAKVQTYKDNGSNAQKWYLHEVSSGKYVLRPKCSSVCVLDVKGASKKENTPLQIYSNNGSACQQFTIVKSGSASTTAKPAPAPKFEITNAKISNITSTGYTVTCNVSAPNGVQKVLFPTWTTASGQDDITWHNGTISGSKVTYQVKISDHKSQYGEYNTHIYLYDKKGKSVGVAIPAVTVSKPKDSVTGLTIANLGNDFYAKINTKLSGSLNLSLSDTNVIIYGDSSKPAQVWHFVRQSDGSYKIVNTKNGLCLDVQGATSTKGTNVQIYKDNGSTAQRWYILETSGGYILRAKCAGDCVLDVSGGKAAAMTNVQIWTRNSSTAQKFNIKKVSAPSTSNQMEVIRKIIYAVETGGQVYGKADYTNFTEAYTNSSSEHAITIGAGQWYAGEAKTLLNKIRSTDPATFAKLDTAGIGKDLDSKNWSTYKLSKTSAKAKCIQAIIGSSVGRSCQDQLIDEQMAKFMQEAKNLGVKDIDAQMMCANIRHQGGLSALKRVLGKTKAPYTLDNIYAAMQTDTGNQVGAYKSRQKMVYNSLKKYL